MAITIPTGVTRNWTDYEATSTTSATTAPGAKTLTIQTSKGFSVGDTIGLEALGTKVRTRLKGTVASYNSGTGALSFTMATIGYEAECPSSTSLTIAVGAQTLVTNPGLSLVAGDPVRLVQISNNGRSMLGTVTSYNSTTGDLVMNVTAIVSTGTFTDWVLITDATSTNWRVTSVENDTYTIVGNGVLVLDQGSPLTPPGNINAATRGTFRIRNTSTTTPLVLKFSRFGYGQGMLAQQNGTLDIQGGWIEIGTGSGAAGQAFTIPATIDRPTLIEVETASGSGVYEPWHCGVSGTGAMTENIYRLASADFTTGSELGNVMLFNPATQQATGVNAVPSGAKVRIPNIHITSDIFETYLSAAILSTDLSMTLNYNGATGTTGDVQLGTERMGWTARTGQVYTITRAQRGTTAIAGAKGDKVRIVPFMATTGNQIMRYSETSAAGTALFENMSANYFYLRGTNYARLEERHVGSLRQDWSGSSAGFYGRYIALTSNPTFGGNSYPGGLYIGTLAQDIDIYGLYNLCDSSAAAVTGTTFTSLFSIKTLDRVRILCPKIVANQNVLVFSACTPKIANSYFNDFIVVGGQLNLTNSAGIRINGFKTGDKTNSVDQTTISNNSIQGSNSSDIVIANINKLGSAHRNVFTVLDSNCKNWYLYNVNYDQNNNTTYPLSNSGTNIYLYNGNFGNSRGVNDAIANSATAKGTYLRNVRMTSPQAYASTSGNQYTSRFVADGVTSLSQYWTTANNMVPNYKDTGPFFTLWDDNTAATGTVCLGSFAGESETDMYNFSGAYPDNSGRVYFETTGDYAVFKTTEPIKSVTAFQNAAINIENSLLYNYTVGSAGSGYVSGTVYNVTGGSGTGGQVRLGATTVTTASVFVAGEGYQVGDVLTITGGVSNGTITLTAVPTLEFRIANPSDDITLVSFSSLTKANLSAAIAALTGYNSNIGFNMHVKVTANQTVAGAYLVNIRMKTNNDTAYSAPDAYFTFSNVNSTDTIEFRKSTDNSLITTWTGGGQQTFVGAPLIGTQGYFIRKTSLGVTLKSTIAAPVTIDINNNGTIDLKESLVTVAGVLVSETCEMRLNSTDAVVYTRTGSGDFTLFDADFGTQVYFVRLSSGIVVSSTKSTPITLTTGNNGTVNLFTGNEVQIAQSPEILEIYTNLPKVNRNVIKASKAIPASETF